MRTLRARRSLQGPNLPILPLAAVAMILLAGCLGSTPDADESSKDDKDPALDLSGPLPTTEKRILDSSENGPDPLADLLGEPRTMTSKVAVPDETGRLQLAIDVRASVTQGGSSPDDAVVVRFEDVNGAVLYETPATVDAGKFIETLEGTFSGTHTLVVEYEGIWRVGAVVTAFPKGFVEGERLWIGFPEQTKIDHTFRPDRVNGTSGAMTRFTIYDFDPHEGVENLQHNLYIPELDLKTEGRTTWGETRVLDFEVPTEPGEYAFYCEYHEGTMRGTLVVQ